MIRTFFSQLFTCLYQLLRNMKIFYRPVLGRRSSVEGKNSSIAIFLNCKGLHMLSFNYYYVNILDIYLSTGEYLFNTK